MTILFLLLSAVASADSICNDGWQSPSDGQGACSWHGGIFAECGTVYEIGRNVWAEAPPCNIKSGGGGGALINFDLGNNKNDLITGVVIGGFVVGTAALVIDSIIRQNKEDEESQLLYDYDPHAENNLPEAADNIEIDKSPGEDKKKKVITKLLDYTGDANEEILITFFKSGNCLVISDNPSGVIVKTNTDMIVQIYKDHNNKISSNEDDIILYKSAVLQFKNEHCLQ